RRTVDTPRHVLVPGRSMAHHRPRHAATALTLIALLALPASALAGGATAPAHAGTHTTATTDVAAAVAEMSVDELIGQMTWAHVYGSAAEDNSMAGENQARYGVDTPAQV